MPAPQQGEDSRPASSACVWLVTTLLLLSVLAGGGCLVAFVVLPPSEAPVWIPIVGLVLVALPWAFWIVTCAYRCAAARAAERRSAVAPATSSRGSRSDSPPVS